MTDDFGNWMKRVSDQFNDWWETEGKDTAPPVTLPIL